MASPASLERLSTSSVSSESPASLPPLPPAKEKRAAKNAANTDTLTPKGGQRWSLFSRGGAASVAPLVDEAKFLEVSDAFWGALRKNQVAGVKSALQSVSVLQRERILRTPDAEVPAGEWGPKLPLCRAVVGGNVAMVDALLELQADPWTGDPCVTGAGGKQPANTPAFWGVVYGKTDALRAIYKCTRSTLEARRALCVAVYPEVLSWLVKKGVTPLELNPALRAAVNRNDAQGVRLLAGIGKANVNTVGPLSDTSTIMGSLLASAITNDRFEAAAVLVEFGAGAGSAGADLSGKAAQESFPLTLAIRKGHAGLVRLMLNARPKDLDVKPVHTKDNPAPAPVNDLTYLSATFEAPNPVELYMTLYRGGMQPRTVAQTESLLDQAKEKHLDFLYAFILRQRTLLVLDDEKNTNDAAKNLARTALDNLADALSEHPAYTAPTPLMDHAEAMTLEGTMPGRGLFKIFGRWGAKKGSQAGSAVATAAANSIALYPAGQPLMIGM